MQTSLIAYPKADRFIRVHTSMLFLCDGNQTAAALISFLEYWHNIHQQRMEYDALMNKMLAENDKPPIIEVGGWQFHTDEQLERGVLIAKKDTILKASEFLEAKKHFISTEVPERLQMIYKTGRTKWFLLMVDRINEALRELEFKQSKLFGQPMPPIREKKIAPPKPEIAPTKQMEVILNYYNKRRAWAAKAFRNEEAPTIKGTQKRYVLMIDRLKLRSTAELCLAIEGCMKSDFHQGTNDRKTVYDEFERIMKDDEEVDKFMKRAISSGVTLKMMSDFLEKGGKTIKPPDELIFSLAQQIIPMLIDDVEPRTDAPLAVHPSIKADLFQMVKHAVESQVGMFTEHHDLLYRLITNDKA